MSLVFLAGLLMSALFSMVEAAVISQDRHRLAHLAEQGGRRAQLMQKMTARMDRLLSAILLFNNIANVLCATAAAVMVTRLSGGGEGAAFAASLGVAFLILVVAEISPKIIGVRHAQRLSLWFALPVAGIADGVLSGGGGGEFFWRHVCWRRLEFAKPRNRWRR